MGLELKEERTCPLCVGKGKTKVPVSNFYIASVNDYQKANTKGKIRHRIRLEIKSLFHEDFLDKFYHGEEIAIFVVDLDAYNKANPIDDIVDSQN